MKRQGCRVCVKVSGCGLRVGAAGMGYRPPDPGIL